MSALFQYDTDRGTIGACLDILERAAGRVSRGESAFLGVRDFRYGTVGAKRRANIVSDELRTKIIAEWHRTGSRIFVSKSLGVSMSTVETVTSKRGLKRTRERRFFL